MKTRIVLTLLVLLVAFPTYLYVGGYEGTVKGNLAVKAAEGGAEEYANAYAASKTDPREYVLWAVAVLLLLVWFGAIKRLVVNALGDGGSSMRSGTLLLLVTLALSAVACGPAKWDKYVDLGPNDVAAVVACEGGETGAYNIEEATLVTAKRIPIPLVKKSTGRFWFSFKYDDAIKVFKIDLTPVNQNWTAASDSNSPEDERIAVESLDSVGFSVGGTLQIRVVQENSMAYFRKYRGKSLDEIARTNVRGFIAQSLSAKFGALPLDGEKGVKTCKSEKSAIAKAVLAEAKAQFEQDGITIDYFGLIEGLEYDDKEIQVGITAQIASSQDLITAQNERAAQKERNQRDQEMADRDAYISEKKAEGLSKAAIKKATGEAEAAKLLLADKDALAFEVEMYERRKAAEAKVMAAQHLPKNILPAGSPLLMGLDTK